MFNFKNGKLVVLDRDDEEDIDFHSTADYVFVNDTIEPMTEGTRFKHLSGLGKLPARLASELRPGDVISWNNAPDHSTVISTEPASRNYLRVVLKQADGSRCEKTLRKDSLIAVKRKR